LYKVSFLKHENNYLSVKDSSNNSWGKWFVHALLIVAFPSVIISIMVEYLASYLGFDQQVSLILYVASLFISFSAFSALERKRSTGVIQVNTKFHLRERDVVSSSFMKEVESRLSKLDREKEPDRFVHLSAMLGLSYVQNAVSTKDKALFLRAVEIERELRSFLKCHKVKPEVRSFYDGLKFKINEYSSLFNS